MPAANATLLFGIVHELSVEMSLAPTLSGTAVGVAVSAKSGTIAAVQTSCGDRNTLKSSTSAEALPSRMRTFTALVEPVVLTTDSSELYGDPRTDCVV